MTTLSACFKVKTQTAALSLASGALLAPFLLRVWVLSAWRNLSEDPLKEGLWPSDFEVLKSADNCSLSCCCNRVGSSSHPGAIIPQVVGNAQGLLFRCNVLRQPLLVWACYTLQRAYQVCESCQFLLLGLIKLLKFPCATSSGTPYTQFFAFAQPGQLAQGTAELLQLCTVLTHVSGWRTVIEAGVGGLWFSKVLAVG